MPSNAPDGMHARLIALACPFLLLAACTPPGKPEEERRPEPRSQAHAQRQPRSGVVHTADAYKQRARDVQQVQADDADRQREAVEAATR